MSEKRTSANASQSFILRGDAKGWLDLGHLKLGDSFQRVEDFPLLKAMPLGEKVLHKDPDNAFLRDSLASRGLNFT